MSRSKLRDSNMELARIVAMLFVLIVHADFMSLGWPTNEDSTSAPIFTLGKLLIESFAIACVNLFVLISGWYGIHFSHRKLLGLFFQVIFYSLLIYLVTLGTGATSISIRGVASLFMLTGNYWFVKSYILLFLISPVLNTFVESSSQKTLLSIILGLFVFQSIWGWSNAAKEFQFGYSGMSFAVLYLMARYVRLYADRIKQIPARYDVLLYFFLGIITTTVSFIGMRFSIMKNPVQYFYAYNSPLVILESLCLLLAFSHLNIKSKLVNFIAASCFSVYLVHCSPFLFDEYFCGTIKRLYYGQSDTLMAIVSIFAFIILVFIVSVLIDQIRKFAWTKFQNIKFINRIQ